LAVRDRIEGDFVIIPKQHDKSDEPILLDGMAYDELKASYPVPIYDRRHERDSIEFRFLN